MHIKIARLLYLLIISLLAVLMPYHSALADTLQSNNYKFSETSLGNGGLIQSTSTNFQTNSSFGDTAVGNSSSSNFQIEAGHDTTDDPALTFGVSNGAATFSSNFSASTTATATSSFYVSNYTSYGYVVQIAGATPTNNSYSIPGMTATGPSVPGTEQFGINLVANTSPASIGANPVQGLFGAGVAASNYNTSNQYRYVSGETIASAPKSSGITTYTISFIVNVKGLTPGGQYSANQVLICIGTF